MVSQLRDNEFWQRYPNGGHFTWLRQFLQKGKKLRTAIDCGAHQGMWTTSWNSIVEKIEAFEPNPDVIPMFKDRTFGIDNITLHEVALGDKFSSVSMQYETHTGTYHVKDHSGTIEMKTLDSYNFNDVDIIKIDVEGYEVPLLEGAKETILNNRPVIQIEANHTGDRYGRPKIEISKILSSFGMKRIAKEWPDQIWRFRK